MTISAKDVKELRALTGAGMMACKKALVDAKGDIDKAVVMMRKTGLAKATKQADRVAEEGQIAVCISDDHKQATLVEVNCETDFVAKNSDFRDFSKDVAQIGLRAKVEDVAALEQLPVAGQDRSVSELRHELILKVGENVQIRRIHFMQTAGYLMGYVHGGRIGVLVDLSVANGELAKDVAMHIAASSPRYLSQEVVPPEIVESEREIFLSQVADSKKPPDILNKIVSGKIKKFLNEITLLGQPFVKDPSVRVSQLLQSADAKVNAFVRYQLSELSAQ